MRQNLRSEYVNSGFDASQNQKSIGVRSVDCEDHGKGKWREMMRSLKCFPPNATCAPTCIQAMLFSGFVDVASSKKYGLRTTVSVIPHHTITLGSSNDIDATVFVSAQCTQLFGVYFAIYVAMYFVPP